MSMIVDALQELPADEEIGLAVPGCCWYSVGWGCKVSLASWFVTTCHTNTNG